MIRAKYRERLPQLDGGLFLTDGGLETTLIFHEGWDLPRFEVFVLLDSERGRKALRAYFGRYVTMAIAAGAGFILESPTWRANPDWGTKVGYGKEALAGNNRTAIEFLLELRNRYETPASPSVVSGAIGPRGDGYDPGQVMTPDAAQTYHAGQIAALRDGGADLITAITMTNIPEAIGITRAARLADMPVAISFTLETDGKLPAGESLKDAVRAVDQATGGAPAYYMINCAHPTHFTDMLAEGGAWLKRLRGLRANASKRSHAELDSAADLDAGDPLELGGEYRDLIRRHSQITILGGCCGTDHRHIEAIAAACRHSA